MIEHRDLGLVPEPILEEIGRKSGNKYHALDLRTQAALVHRMIEPQSAPRKKSWELTAFDRYWSATAIGLSEIDDRQKQRLATMLDDDSHGVRVAAALALCRTGDTKTGIPALAALIEDENYLVGMYALRALEIAGPPSRTVLPQIKAAQKSPYEFTRRIARRLTKTLGG